VNRVVRSTIVTTLNLSPQIEHQVTLPLVGDRTVCDLRRPLSARHDVLESAARGTAGVGALAATASPTGAQHIGQLRLQTATALH